MAAAASRAVHREVHACWAALRSKGLVSLARCWANILRKVAASSLQRPPNSIANTTRRALPPCVNSGYVLALLLRAIRRAAPAVAPLDRRTWEEAVRGDTRVVSTASCAPCQNGKAFAITSIRRSSVRCVFVLRSLTRTFVLTAAPASLHTLAIAFSKAIPRVRRAPEWGQAALWSPSWSCGRWHRHLAVCAASRRRRRRSNTRK